MARGVARGLGVPENVPITSPTFTLMNHYPARLELYHFDLYRLSDPDELIEIGFDDFAFGTGAALVEWPERLGDDDTPGLWICIKNCGNACRSDITVTGRLCCGRKAVEPIAAGAFCLNIKPRLKYEENF